MTVLLSGCTDIAQELGLTQKGPGTTAPRAEFEATYDSEDEQVTVAHEVGGEVPAANLYLRGTGLAETGSWVQLGGETSTSDGVEVIGTGYKLTVGASPDFSAQVVWEAGDTSMVYLETSGPEA